MSTKAFSFQFSNNRFESLSHQVDQKIDGMMNGSKEGPSWLHFDSPSKNLKQKLSKKFMLPKSVRHIFFADEVRSRCIRIDDYFICILHSISLDNLHTEKDFPSLRILLTKKYILTVSTDKIQSVDTVKKQLATKAEMNIYLCLSEILENLMSQLEDVIHLVDEKLYKIESHRNYGRELGAQLVSVRQDIVYIRHYVFPQRNALISLTNKLYSLDSETLSLFKELSDNMTRHLEAVEMLRERARVMQDHLTSHVADVTNQRIYVLTVIMLIFTPAFFIMSLFSMYIPMPGMNNSKTWWIICGVIFAISYILYKVFRKKKWI